MNDTAAHLLDRVIPHVPIRQWVMTFPRRIRDHLAADPKVATMALREVTRRLFTFRTRSRLVDHAAASSEGAGSPRSEASQAAVM